MLSIERKITVGSSLWHRLPACDLTSTGWKPMPLIFRTMLRSADQIRDRLHNLWKIDLNTWLNQCVVRHNFIIFAEEDGKCHQTIQSIAPWPFTPLERYSRWSACIQSMLHTLKVLFCFARVVVQHDDAGLQAVGFNVRSPSSH